MKPATQMPHVAQDDHLMWYDRFDTSPLGMVQTSMQAPDLTRSMLNMMDAIGTVQVLQREIEQ